MIITKAQEVRAIYAEAKARKWVLPCLCTENLTTTEAIMAAANEFGKEHGMDDVMITIAITCNYSHRSQAPNYTHTRDWRTGLRLFKNDIEALADKDGYYRNLRVMTHLDHVQYDLDKELYEGDLTGYSSIMFDASNLPFEENIRLTAAFVEEKKHEIMIEGACDEIVDATGSVHNHLTTPESAKHYMDSTGVDMIVANLGTEHRATGKQLQYHADVAAAIKQKIGTNIVLHGASSASNDQLVNLFSDGVVKVNVWTALERDSSPVLFADMIKNAEAVAGSEVVRSLVQQGYLTEKCLQDKKPNIANFTTMYRQDIAYSVMKDMVKAYLDMWYKL